MAAACALRWTRVRSTPDVLSFLVFVVGVLVVGGLLFLGASLLLGRGETQPPADPTRSPVELPDDRPVLGDDVRALRLTPAFRGYRMSEVDWLIDQFAQPMSDTLKSYPDIPNPDAFVNDANGRIQVRIRLQNTLDFFFGDYNLVEFFVTPG